MSEEKKARSSSKSILTREINNAKRLIAEEDKNEIVSCLDRIKQKFRDFQQSHDAYHHSLTDEGDIEDSDNYFFEVQDNYIASLTSTKAWLKQQSVIKSEPKEDDAMSTASSGDSLSQMDFLSLINLPKVELETFDGDPLRYHSFLAVFDENVDSLSQDGRAKLTRLLQYTSGDAKSAIRPCALVGGETGYKQARDILQKRFGNHHIIAEKIIGNLRNGKPIRTADDLQKLSDDMINCLATLNRMNKMHEVDTQSSIVQIVNRLQPYMRNRWRRVAMDQKRERDSYPSFRNLVDFVCKEADEATDPVYGQTKFNVKAAAAHTSDAKPKSTSFTTAAYSTGRYMPQCILCGQSHRLFYCDTFKSLKPLQRFQVVKDHKLCENCLLSNHVVSNCRKPSVCSVEGCGKKHTKFIHIDQVNNDRNVDTTVSGSHENRVKVVNNSITKVGTDVYVPVVSVKVNHKCDALALLDTASTSTFCTRKLVDELNIKGSSVTYVLSTLNCAEKSKCSQVVNICLMSQDGINCLNLSNVYVIDEIPVKGCTVDVTKFDHLCDLPIEKSISGVDILLGQDNAEALLPLQLKRGKKGEPFAVRTLFGWSVNGPSMINELTTQSVVSHFITTDAIEQRVNDLWLIENEGLSPCDISMSQDDKKVIKLWDENIVTVDGHYVLPIPWKDDAYLPNNIGVAQSRLFSLRVSLNRRNIMDRYDAEIDKMIRNRYAEEVPLDKIHGPDKVWYLPHHAVITDKKPDKLRIVFDCASRFQGESLNDKCLQGPDLNNKLLYVLLKFRQHKYAIMSDVEAMYYQVRVSEDHRDSLRFLWYDSAGNIVHYRMTSHVFGGVWCACVATYALRRTIEDNAECNELVVDTVRNAFYVDDCLKSVESEVDAITVIEGTKALLAKGGFRLTKFVINDEKLLASISIDDRAKEVKDFKSNMSSKALGVKWNVKTDEFYFVVELKDDNVTTRRSILSTVSSTFDPLGLVSPVLIVGKILFQDATRLKLSWDEQVSDELSNRWKQWLKSVNELEHIRIPRCVKTSDFDDAYIELHNFSDASERAYGCCSYIRCVNKQGQISTALLMSKSKVTPIKSISIPRLELQAAVISAQMGAMLIRELDIVICASYYWVDSQIVLQYIQNETRRFHVYVGNRVTTIHNLTEPQQWHHIPGKENPADRITRGQNPEQLNDSSWFHGPEFLRSYKSSWDIKSCDDVLTEDDPEVKVVSSCCSCHRHRRKSASP
jgi:hypothetical protein